MLELKRSLNGLKKNIYGFQDISDSANYTFKVTDLPDKFLLGKNSFKLHLKEDVLVSKSQVYIDIVDSFGNPIYYKVISDNLPNKERIVAVYIYDTTPVGDCELIIAGRLAVNPKTGQKIPYSNEVSSPEYHGIPNVVWRKVVQINPQEVESPVYFSIPPTVTYSEVRKPQYELSTNNRLISLYSTASSAGTMYSNRGQMNTIDDVNRRPGDTTGHVISTDTSSATFVPITAIGDGNEIASLYFKNFDLTASMEGGRVYFNNIPYSYPSNAVVTESKVLNYSGSIIKVVDKNTCFVTPTFYHVLGYTDSAGISRKLVLDGFREAGTFTASYHTEPSFSINTSSYNSYVNLEINNAEPDIGSVKSIKVKAKSINKPGQYVDLGTFNVDMDNILLVGDSSYTMTSKGIEPLSLGDFRKLVTPENYWTGSTSTGTSISFTNNDAIINGVLFPSTGTLSSVSDYYEMYLLPQYMVPVKKDTEYELSFDVFYPDLGELSFTRQLDVYISGSEISSVTENQDAVHQPLKLGRFGTYIGSVDSKKTNRHRPKFYFIATKTGNITPRLVNRITGAVYADMQLTVRNEPGYSSKYIKLEVPLPNEFISRAELSIDLEYYNSKNERANLGTSLYGVVFEGNTPKTGSSTVIPSGTISGSDQLTSSFDDRYEFKGRGGIYSGSGRVPANTIVSASNIKFETDQNLDDWYINLNFNRIFDRSTNSLVENSGTFSITDTRGGSLFTSFINLSAEEHFIKIGSNVDSGSNIEMIVSNGGLIIDYDSGSHAHFTTFDSNGVVFTDMRSNPKGIEYSLNMTSSLVNKVRSIPDVGTVREMFSSASLVSSSAQIKNLLPTGVVSGSEQLTSSYDVRYHRLGTGILSSSNQIASDISGSFTSVSSSLAGRIAVYDAKTIVSSSAQVKILLPTATVSGSEQLTSSYDTRYHRLGTGIISSSNQISTEISGAFFAPSSSLAGRISVFENKTLYSSSIQVNYNEIINKPNVSGSFLGGIAISSGSSSSSYFDPRIKAGTGPTASITLTGIFNISGEIYYTSSFATKLQLTWGGSITAGTTPSITWTNMPAGSTTWLHTSDGAITDEATIFGGCFTGYTQCNLTTIMLSPGAGASTILTVEYSPDNSSWTSLLTCTIGNTTGVKQSNWTRLPADLLGFTSSYLRLTGRNGDGATDPRFTTPTLLFR